MNQKINLPGWYRINSNNDFRYFDGNGFEERIENFPVSSDIKYFLGPNQKPRNRALRLLLLLAGWLAITFAIIGVALLGGSVTDEQALDGLGRIIGLVVIGIICTSVGYRWFDAFLALIPFYGAFFIAKMLWRVSVLPHRYWTMRGEVTPNSYEDLKLMSADEGSTVILQVENQITKKSKISNFQSKGALLALSVILVFAGFVVVVKSTGLLDSLGCNNLKKDLANQDLVGRDLWNSYQREVSNLNNFEPYSGQYYNQVRNVARRLIQVEENDKAGYLQILESPKCALDIADVSKRLQGSEYTINFLKGEEVDSMGAKWTPYNGWNVDYYNIYKDFKTLLK